MAVDLKQALKLALFLTAKALLLLKLIFDFIMLSRNKIDFSWNFNDDKYVEGLGYFFLLI
jgi:hypothetical protein